MSQSTITHSIQAPGAVVMVRPHRFHPNPETAADNLFQASAAGLADPAALAYAEVSAAAERLRAEGVTVHLFEDHGMTETPDSVFPNNWFSTHVGGHIAMYPMYSASRRRERRSDVIDMLKMHYRVQDVIDYSGLEPDGVFLEGTGAMVLDHVSRVAYTAQSNRANPVALERFCTHFNYEPMSFATADSKGQAVYHTNVMMCVGTSFVLIGLDLIADAERRKQVRMRLEESGRAIIELSAAQINSFAGNAIELATSHGRILALSETAHASLSADQIRALSESVKLVPLSVPTIELAGGSVRCMLAGIHLARR